MPIEEVGMAKIGSFFLVGCDLLSCFVFWILEFWDFGFFFFLFFFFFCVTDAYRRGGYGEDWFIFSSGLRSGLCFGFWSFEFFFFSCCD